MCAYVCMRMCEEEGLLGEEQYLLTVGVIVRYDCHVDNAAHMSRCVSGPFKAGLAVYMTIWTRLLLSWLREALQRNQSFLCISLVMDSIESLG